MSLANTGNYSKNCSNFACTTSPVEAESNSTLDAAAIIDISFQFVFMITGTLGNLLVILSILFDKRTHQHGNIFILNLAVADLIVSLIS